MQKSTGDGRWDLLLNFLCTGKGTSDVLRHHPGCLWVFGHYRSAIPASAIGLWHASRRHDGFDLPVVVSGGMNERSRGFIPPEYQSEAEYFRDLMVYGGVAEKSFLLETKSANTLQNVQAVVGAAAEAIFRQTEVVIVCAFPPLLRRTIATCGRWLSGIEFIGHSYPLSESWFGNNINSRAFILKEFQSMQEYASKGDILPVEIPPDVAEAERALREEFI